VEAACNAVLPFLDRPFCFFGHSMGAIVSFELARYLRRHHHLSPVQMIVSGRRAPHVPDPDPPKYSLSDEEFVAEIRRLNGTPPEALQSEELMQLLIPLLRADCEVIDVYECNEESPLATPITVFGGLNDQEAPRDEMDEWRRHTVGAFAVRMFPGDHFFLHTCRPLMVQTLARELLHLQQGMA